MALVAVLAGTSVAIGACGDDPNENGNGGNGGGSLFDEFDDASLETEEDAEDWASASAPQVYFLSIYTPLLITMGDEEDEDCPVVVEDPQTGNVEVSGGCTDLDGREWSGSMTMTQGDFDQELWFPEGDQSLSISEVVVDGFGYQGMQSCESNPGIEESVDFTLNGQVTTQALGGDRYGFDIDLMIEGKSLDAETCELMDGKAITVYEGDVEVLEIDADTGMATAHRWQGSGTRAEPEDGQAEIETIDELLDAEGCEYKPMSGATKISAGGVEMEIVYDGETNCDAEASAKWYLDGEEMGVIEGVSCSSTRGGPVGPAMVLLMLVMVALQRRQTSRRPQ